MIVGQSVASIDRGAQDAALLNEAQLAGCILVYHIEQTTAAAGGYHVSLERYSRRSLFARLCLTGCVCRLVPIPAAPAIVYKAAGADPVRLKGLEEVPAA